MQDLATIIRNNTRATNEDIPRQRASGKFVVACYCGLNYYGHDSFNTRAEAQADLQRRVSGNFPGERFELLEPLGQVASEGVTL